MVVGVTSSHIGRYIVHSRSVPGRGITYMSYNLDDLFSTTRMYYASDLRALWPPTRLRGSVVALLDALNLLQGVGLLDPRPLLLEAQAGKWCVVARVRRAQH